MKKITSVFLTLILALAMTACSASGTAETQTSAAAAVEPTSVPTVASAAEALSAKNETHESADDYTWDAATAETILLEGDSISTDAEGVQVEGQTARIVAAGTYSLSGTLNNGQIMVETESEATVRLVLNGVSLANSTSAAINILQAEKVILALADGSQNTISDAASYVYPDTETDEPNAAIFAKSNLSIGGNGTLTINANFNDGIASKDGLIIAGGTINLTAIDDGIRGKDYLMVKNGNLTINTGGDGLKSDNEEDITKGYIAIEDGVFNITAGGDAVSAQTDVLVSNGSFTLSSGGGNSASLAEDASAKGIKAVANLNIDGGTFNIDAADDALHSNNNLVINAGTFNITSGDDGMHADATLTINEGEINISQSYEGIESAVITINAGTIHVTASDDGINVAGGVDGSGVAMPGERQRPGAMPGAQPPQAGGAQPPQGGMPPSGQQDAFNANSSYYLYIHGGYIVVEARGDGIDVNGAMEMTDGVVLVNGPTEDMNAALDYDAGFKMSGGFFVAAGSAGMAMAPGADSGQNSVLVYLGSAQSAGTLFHIQNSAGEDILTFAPSKEYQSVAFSSPELVNGETYTIFTSGSSSGSNTDSLYQGGSYTAGTQVESFTVSSIVTQVGSGGRGPGRP